MRNIEIKKYEGERNPDYTGHTFTVLLEGKDIGLIECSVDGDIGGSYDYEQLTDEEDEALFKMVQDKFPELDWKSIYPDVNL